IGCRQRTCPFTSAESAPHRPSFRPSRKRRSFVLLSLPLCRKPFPGQIKKIGRSASFSCPRRAERTFPVDCGDQRGPKSTEKYRETSPRAHFFPRIGPIYA